MTVGWLLAAVLASGTAVADTGDTGLTVETGIFVTDPEDDGGGDGASYSGNPGRFGNPVQSGSSASEWAGDTGGRSCGLAVPASVWVVWLTAVAIRRRPSRP